MVKKYGFLITVLFFLGQLTGCQKAAEPLKIASNIWIGYEPIYAAQALNLTAVPLELHKKASATEVMAMFEQGLVDAACLTLDEAMLLIEKGVELSFAAVLDISDGADQLVANTEITELAMLKGKKIAVETTALGMLLLNGVLEAADLSQQDVQIVSSTVDQHYQLMKNQEVDAAITFPPFSEKLKELSAKTLYDSSQMKNAPIVDVLVINNKVKEYKYQQVSALINSVYKVNQQIKEQHPTVIEYLGTSLDIPKADWHSLTDGVLLMDKSINQDYLYRYKLEATMLILNDVMLKNAMLKTGIKNKISPDMFLRL